RNNAVVVHGAYFVAGHVTTNRVGIVRTLELFGGDLHSAVRAVDRGKAVDAVLPAGDLPDEDRAAIDVEGRRLPIDRKPEQRLTIDPQQRRELRDELRKPRPCGDDRRRSRILAAVGRDRDAARSAVDSDDTLVASDDRAAVLRRAHVSGHAALRTHEARVLLEISMLGVADLELREAAPDLGRVEKLVRDAELERGGERVVEEVLDVRVRLRRAAGND